MRRTQPAVDRIKAICWTPLVVSVGLTDCGGACFLKVHNGRELVAGLVFDEIEIEHLIEVLTKSRENLK